MFLSCNNRRGLIHCLLLLGLLGANNLQAQNSRSQDARLQDIQAAEIAALERGAAAQETINNLDDERILLKNTYRNTLKEISNIKTYNQQLRDTVARQEEEKQLLLSQIERIGSLEQDIVPLMVDMLDALENFINLDVPFLLSERKARVGNLRNLLSDPDLANSEKYRRILEAYQIENDYGRTIEAYDKKLNDDPTAPLVTYIKIGRLAFFYQSLDGSQTHRWSNSKGVWEKLDDGSNAAVQTAIAMAKERIPSNLLLVPVEIPADVSAIAQRGEF